MFVDKNPKDLKLVFPPEEILIFEENQSTAVGLCRVPNGLIYKFYDVYDVAPDNQENKDEDPDYELELKAATTVVVKPDFFSDYEQKKDKNGTKKEQKQKSGPKTEGKKRGPKPGSKNKPNSGGNETKSSGGESGKQSGSGGEQTKPAEKPTDESGNKN